MVRVLAFVSVDDLMFSTKGILTSTLKQTRLTPNGAGQTLSRSYGRCIAEFLSEGSLVSLGLLDLSTCVGLRYGRQNPRVQLLFLSAWVTQLMSSRDTRIRASPILR